jgi:hypothetical protein
VYQETSELGQGDVLIGQIAFPMRKKKQYWSQPHTCYRLPVKPASMNAIQNLREHQFSSVCLVVPFWLAVM